MEKLTKKQKIFLISYPFLHYLFVILFFIMTMSKGFIREPEDPPITVQQEIVSAIGMFFSNILLAPFFLLDKVGFSIHPAPGLPYIDCLYVFLVGIAYGYVFLYTYKFLRKK